MHERLTPIEAIMWRVGQDATLRMTVGAVLILDRPPSVDQLGERLASAMDNAPRLRQRPDDALSRRARPVWVDDADPAGQHHLRTLSIGASGSLRQALDLVALLESVPFEPERSPWDVTLIQELEDGRAALYLRAHHVLTDGVGGSRLLGFLVDEPGWPGTAVRAPSGTRAAGGQTAPGVDRKPGTITITVDLPNAARLLVERVNSMRYRQPITDRAARRVQGALDMANSVSRQMFVLGGRLSWQPPVRGLVSHFEVFSVSGARRSSLALGGSRNDLLVAAAAAGLGLYAERLGRPSRELRVATPTGQRRTGEVIGNWFAPTRVEIPTDVARPVPQFGIIVERLAQGRREPALRVAASLAAAIERLPTRALVSALQAQADSVDFAATALPGLRTPRHICGARVETSFPLGPRLGCPMNITAFGNDDRLDIGVALDPVAFTEPDVLVECLTEAFQRFARAAGDNRDHVGVSPNASGSVPQAGSLPGPQERG